MPPEVKKAQIKVHFRGYLTENLTLCWIHCNPFDPSWGSRLCPIEEYSFVGICSISGRAPEAVFRKSIVHTQQLFTESMHFNLSFVWISVINFSGKIYFSLCENTQSIYTASEIQLLH